MLAEAVNPVQYLGSKARLLAPILAAHRRAARPPGVAVDLFSGSSVVSQALATRAPVVGVDASAAAGVLFAGMLSGRAAGEGRGAEGDAAPPAGEGRRAEGDALLPAGDDELAERAALRARDVDALLRLYRARHTWFQQEYRPTKAWWARHTQRGARWVEALYGGHYFGIQQARALDELRAACTTPVERAALLATASRIVASAGKHFATPLNFLALAEPTPFVKRRLMDDRRRDVRATFAQLLVQVSGTPAPPHAATSRFVRAELPARIEVEDASFVYADPPYTTDQYSRFYHLLDSLARDEPFTLALVDGAPTKGRYPSARSSSPFSSASRAPAAFARLYDDVRALGAPFAFSYSAPRVAGARSRTVALDDLRDLLLARFSTVGTLELDHKYRPLQPAARMRPSASETLILATP